jgi:hypothetical protein
MPKCHKNSKCILTLSKQDYLHSSDVLISSSCEQSGLHAKQGRSGVLLMNGSLSVFGASILLACAAATSASGADFATRFVGKKPAVSAVNAQLTVGYRYSNFDSRFRAQTAFGAATISAPLGLNIGAKVSVDHASNWTRRTDRSDPTDRTSSFGLGTSVFWRNPDVGYFGVNTGISRSDGDNFTNKSSTIGASASLYYERFTVSIGASERYSKTTRASIVAKRTATRAELGGTFYVTDDLSLSASAIHIFDKSHARTDGVFGMTYLLPTPSKNIAVSASGNFSRNETGASIALSFYFGQSGKSLKARDRED